MATDATPTKEADNDAQPHFVQSSAAMNKFLNASSDKERPRFSEPFHGNSSRTVPGDGDRVFAEPPPSNHPSMQYAYEGRNFTPQRESSRRDEGYFATPFGYSHSSALPYGQGWGGHGIPWQTHPALQQFESLQQRILNLEHRTVAEGEFKKGVLIFHCLFPSLFRYIEFFEGFSAFDGFLSRLGYFSSLVKKPVQLMSCLL